MILLNVSCGSNLFPGWKNSDKVDLSDYIAFLKHGPKPGMPLEQERLATRVQSVGIDFEVRDVLGGFPDYEDDSVDFIYWGQAIEHFNRRTEVPRILAEFKRILKPGGKLRVTTPDIELLIQMYRENRLSELSDDQPEFFADAFPEDQLAYLMYGAAGPGSTSSSYEGHHHLYSTRTLVELFEKLDMSQELGTPPPHGAVDQGMSHSVAVTAVKKTPAGTIMTPPD